MAENTFASQKFCNGDDTQQENGSSDAHVEDAKSNLEIIRKGIDDPDEKDDKEDHSRGPFVLFKPIDEDSDSECDAVDNFRVQPHSNVKNTKSLNDNSVSEVSNVHKSLLDRGDNFKSNKEPEIVPIELSETPKSNIDKVEDDSGGQNTDVTEKLMNGIIGIDSVFEAKNTADKERTDTCDENSEKKAVKENENNSTVKESECESTVKKESEQHSNVESMLYSENEQHNIQERKEENENEQHSRLGRKEENENEQHARLDRKGENENEQHAKLERKGGNENEQHAKLERKEENENEQHTRLERKGENENEQHAKLERKEENENEQHAKLERKEENENEQHTRLERKGENENERHAKLERKGENEKYSRVERKEGNENEKHDKVEITVSCDRPTKVDQEEKGIRSMKTKLVKVEDQEIKKEESQGDRTENYSYHMEEVMNVDGSKVIITLNDNESDQEKDYKKKKDTFPDEKARETKKELKENSVGKSGPFPVINSNDSNKSSVVDPAAKSSGSKDKVAVLTTPGKSSGQGNDSVMVVSITPPGPSATVLTNSLKAGTTLASTMSSLNMPMHSGIRMMPPNVVTVPQQNAAFIPYYLPQSSVPFPLQNRVTTPRMTVSPHTQQTGYITKVGNQTIFVPLANSTGKPIAPFPTVANMRASYMPQNAVMTATGQHSSAVKPEVNKVTEFVTPKSSMDMMEMCKWEIANRMPDNYNWSVVFHPKKDMEVSAITAFLQELGSDIVKEAVYKDIIQIQTNKKEMGKLTDGEIVSLEKMKTVYKETKDRVGDLKLDYKKCRACNFITESRNVMAYHKEFAHNGLKEGDLLCARCNFSTRNKEAFVFHMESEHQLQGKIVEKRAFYECELCPFETNNKNKLTRHRFRCAKQFKLQQNLQPYYHDVNFCMKTMYFKVKKPVIKNPVHDTRQRNQNLTQKTKAAQPNQQPQKVVAMPMVSTNMNMIRQVSPQTATLRMPYTIPPNTPTTNIAANKQHLASALQKPVQSNLFPHTSPVGQFSINKPAAPAPISSPATTIGRMDMSKFEVCELCGGYVKDRQALRIHFYYAHKVEMPLSIFSRPQPPLICEVCQARFWTTQGLSKHKTNTKHFSAPSPASSKDQRCFMCSRTVPNLFVHIEQVHGITMKDLVAMKKCIMCGTTSSNRRELEIHMAALHGVLIKASEIDKPAPIGTAFKAVPSPVQGAAVIAGKKQSLVRNNLCVFCQVQFNDNIQLTMHCIKNHATCSACGMVVARKADLENHHCKKLASRSCPLCNLRKLTPEAYLKHVKTHMKKCSVNVKQMSEDELAKYPKPVKKPVEVINLLDSDDDDDNDSQASSDKVKTAAGVKLEDKEAEENHKKKTAQEDDMDVSKNSAKEQEPESENSKTRKRKLDRDDNDDSRKEKSEDDGQPAEKVPNLESEKEQIELGKSQ